jgi:hypothetical protein
MDEPNYLNGFIMNPMFLYIILVIIVIYVVIAYYLGNSENQFAVSDSGNGSSSIIKKIAIFILVLIVLVYILKYFFGISLTAYITGLFSSTTKLNVVIDKTTSNEPNIFTNIKARKQVFNIPGNYYNFENARAVCKAYDSKLATYDQIEKAYNEGAEWCNYGWSANQLALFPTQRKTFNHLQTIKGHENDCGRTGINGGYIKNPRVRFGVNCYGYKPRIREEEEYIMENTTPFPQNEKDKMFQKRVDFWENKTDEILLSPFNHNTWSAPIL